jgi:hypothetical protein
MIRVLPITPSLEILGGRSVQATRLLELLRQASAVNALRYCVQLFSGAWRADTVHIFSAGLSALDKSGDPEPGVVFRFWQEGA